MLIALNIGNTHVQYAVFDGSRCVELRQYATSEFSSDLLPVDIPVAASSVVPAIREKLTGRDIFWVNPAMRSRVDFSLVDPRTVGADRLANVVALTSKVALPAACFDFGTAITLEVVDEHLKFRGGAIAPGRMLLRRSLHDYTAQLPLIPLSLEAPRLAGTNTVDAMRLGIDRGAVGSVRELVSIVKSMFPDRLVSLVGIGGDADFFTNAIPEIASGGTDFTLQGIRISWELNQL